MDGYGRWGHDFKSRASTVPPSRLETVPSLIQPKVADHGFESQFRITLLTYRTLFNCPRRGFIRT